MRHRYFPQAVWRYWESGLSLIPINTRTKRPYSRLLPQACNTNGDPLYYQKKNNGTLSVTTDKTTIRKGTWEPYQKQQATADEIGYWLTNGVCAIAAIGGDVSGGLEIIDFDVGGYYEKWVDLVYTEDVIGVLPTQRTGGGGMQMAWRCPEPEGNQKLAWHPDESYHSGRCIAIETRGKNGYALMPPSLHPSGNFYELIAGKFSAVPMLTQEQRDYLLKCARSLCQAPKTRQEIAHAQNPRASTPQEFDGESVIDVFNARYSVDAMLRRYNYTPSGNGRYSRPGKEDSAGVVIFDNGKSYHMSSNDPLDSDAVGLHQPRSAFDFYAQFEHDGSYRNAVRMAAQELGINRRKYPQIHRVGS